MHVCPVAQSCLTLWPMDYSLPGSSFHGILQGRILERVVIFFSMDLPDPGIEHKSPALAGGFFTTEPPGKPWISCKYIHIPSLSCLPSTPPLLFSILKKVSVLYLESEVTVAQSCPNVCDPMDYTVHGILQARILEWVAFPFSGGSSQPRGGIQVSHIAGRFFTSWATREAGI